MKPGCAFIRAASAAHACSSWSSSPGSTVNVLISRHRTDFLRQLRTQGHPLIHLLHPWHRSLLRQW
jgi:hypothetical protein